MSNRIKVMAAAEYSENVSETARSYRAALLDLEDAYENAAGIHAVDYTRTRVQTSLKGDVMADAIQRIDGMVARLAEAVSGYADAVEEYDRCLSRMSRASASVLRAHYVRAEPWSSIADSLGYTPGYVRGKVRDAALAELYDVMPMEWRVPQAEER